MFALAPLLWGAGLGALGGLITGKDPLKGALVGGATGGLLGGLPAGAWAGGAAEAAKTGLATGAGSAAAGTGVALGDIAASSALPTALQGSGIATGIGSGAGAGIGGAGINLSQGAGNLAYGFNPVAQGAGMGSIDNLAQYSTGAGTDMMANNPSMFDKISPYLDVRDLGGAADLMQKFQPQQRQVQPQSGNVTRGQAPEGSDVMSLLKSIKQPERRRITLL